MYRSLDNPQTVISLDELRNLYPDIYIGAELSPSSLRDLNLPYTTTDVTMLKTDKLDMLEASFDERVQGAFTTSQGYLMQFNTSDSLKMQGAITLMEAVGSSTGYITQANDVTKYNIPIETMKQVLIEMLNAYAKCHARKQELRKQINDAQSKEELAEITISWPV